VKKGGNARPLESVRQMCLGRSRPQNPNLDYEKRAGDAVDQRTSMVRYVIMCAFVARAASRYAFTSIAYVRLSCRVRMPR
jgi:hypothetical protein